jgi:hypothetical protein
MSLQKLPTDYLEKLTAYKCPIIYLHQKHNYLLQQTGSADKTTTFFDKMAYSTTDAKASKSILVKATGHEKLRRTVVL